MLLLLYVYSYMFHFIRLESVQQINMFCRQSLSSDDCWSNRVIIIKHCYVAVSDVVLFCLVAYINDVLQLQPQIAEMQANALLLDLINRLQLLKDELQNDCCCPCLPSVNLSASRFSLTHAFLQRMEPSYDLATLYTSCRQLRAIKSVACNCYYRPRRMQRQRMRSNVLAIVLTVQATLKCLMMMSRSFVGCSFIKRNGAAIHQSVRMLKYRPVYSRIKIQEGLAVASIARDDPSPFPGMHRDHNALPSQTDRQTDTDILHLALIIGLCTHMAILRYLASHSKNAGMQSVCLDILVSRLSRTIFVTSRSHHSQSSK